MLNIKVKDMIISLDLFFEKSFVNAYKYKSDEKPTFFIKSLNKPFDEAKLESFKYKSKCYDLYETKNSTIQKQYSLDGEFLGYIEYVDNYAYLYMNIPSFYNEYFFTQYALVYFLSKSNDSIFMHGSSLKYKNKGIIFTAKSGTGKSTHTRLWRKLSDAITINDDKNIITYENDNLKIYSSPWSGKEHIANNITSSLDAIVFLYQSPTNQVRRLKPMEAFKLLLGQIEMLSLDNKEIWNKIVDKMLTLPIYYYGCNMEDEAFYVIKNKLEEDLCL